MFGGVVLYDCVHIPLQWLIWKTCFPLVCLPGAKVASWWCSFFLIQLGCQCHAGVSTWVRPSCASSKKPSMPGQYLQVLHFALPDTQPDKWSPFPLFCPVSYIPAVWVLIVLSVGRLSLLAHCHHMDGRQDRLPLPVRVKAWSHLWSVPSQWHMPETGWPQLWSHLCPVPQRNFHYVVLHSWCFHNCSCCSVLNSSNKPLL